MSTSVEVSSNISAAQGQSRARRTVVPRVPPGRRAPKLYFSKTKKKHRPPAARARARALEPANSANAGNAKNHRSQRQATPDSNERQRGNNHTHTHN
eukprot:scaffold49_cov115-Isochrysis_galbana.AAC.4